MHLTEEAVSPNASFICKDHPREVQVQAAGRKYSPETDEADKEIHFQNHQFDKDLRRSGRAEGTDHVLHQGSNVLTADDLAGKKVKAEDELTGE